MVSRVLPLMKAVGLPLEGLEVTEPDGSVGSTYHVSHGRTVKATWSTPPSLSAVAALNAALEEGPRTLTEALKSLDQGGLNAVTVAVLADYLVAHPSLAVSLGLPTNDES